MHLARSSASTTDSERRDGRITRKEAATHLHSSSAPLRSMPPTSLFSSRNGMPSLSSTNFKPTMMTIRESTVPISPVARRATPTSASSRSPRSSYALRTTQNRRNLKPRDSPPQKIGRRKFKRAEPRGRPMLFLKRHRITRTPTIGHGRQSCRRTKFSIWSLPGLATRS